VQGEGHAGDGAEVPAAAAQRPEQVQVLIRGHRQHACVGRDDFGGEQVVAAQPQPAVQPAGPAAQRGADHADRGHIGTGHRETRRLGSLIHHVPGGAAAHGGHPLGGVDPHRDQRGQVEHHRSVSDAVTGVAVPSAPHAHRQPPAAGEPDHRLDVGYRQRPGD
jgi:hypothetical protein